jgi:hypothetical protein
MTVRTDESRKDTSLEPCRLIFCFISSVDHTGVPNSQLVKEQAVIASVYKNKSVAEQNSVDIGTTRFCFVTRACSFELKLMFSHLLRLRNQHGSF